MSSKPKSWLDMQKLNRYSSRRFQWYHRTTSYQTWKSYSIRLSYRLLWLSIRRKTRLKTIFLLLQVLVDFKFFHERNLKFYSRIGQTTEKLIRISNRGPLTKYNSNYGSWITWKKWFGSRISPERMIRINFLNHFLIFIFLNENFKKLFRITDHA